MEWCYVDSLQPSVTPNSDKHLIFPYNIALESNLKGHENNGKDHLLKKVLIVKQIIFAKEMLREQ